MIFRKDNRGESFQRQISELRKQLEPDASPEDDDYRYVEPQDTSQFGTDTSQFATRSPLPTRDEPFAATRAPEPAPAPATQTFSTQQPQPTQTFRPTWQTADANTSVIAANAHWNGVLRTDGSLHIHGRADGELHAANDVFVAEGAEVDAELLADNVVVAGTVRGRIEARGRLEVLPQGHVAGDVKAPKLVVHEGARLSGQLKMEAGGQAGAAPQATAGRRRGRE